jgi:hypothetical protein
VRLKASFGSTLRPLLISTSFEPDRYTYLLSISEACKKEISNMETDWQYSQWLCFILQTPGTWTACSRRVPSFCEASAFLSIQPLQPLSYVLLFFYNQPTIRVCDHSILFRRVYPRTAVFRHRCQFIHEPVILRRCLFRPYSNF